MDGERHDIPSRRSQHVKKLMPVVCLRAPGVRSTFSHHRPISSSLLGLNSPTTASGNTSLQDISQDFVCMTHDLVWSILLDWPRIYRPVSFYRISTQSYGLDDSKLAIVLDCMESVSLGCTFSAGFEIFFQFFPPVFSQSEF